jgi:hypothetical protein
MTDTAESAAFVPFPNKATVGDSNTYMWLTRK